MISFSYGGKLAPRVLASALVAKIGGRINRRPGALRVLIGVRDARSEDGKKCNARRQIFRVRERDIQPGRQKVVRAGGNGGESSVLRSQNRLPADGIKNG